MMPFAEIFGESPASTLLGSPPPQEMLQTVCSVPAGLLVGLGNCPEAFLPSPRTYTITLPSTEKFNSEIGSPSSSRYAVSLHALKDGPSATQMLRLPSWLNVQARRLAALAAVRFSGNGALMSSSTVTFFCAHAHVVEHATASTSTKHFFISSRPLVPREFTE